MADQWRCPECGAVLKKPAYAATFMFSRVAGATRCGNCGAAFAPADVYEGKYDVDSTSSGRAEYDPDASRRYRRFARISLICTISFLILLIVLPSVVEMPERDAERDSMELTVYNVALSLFFVALGCTLLGAGLWVRARADDHAMESHGGQREADGVEDRISCLYMVPGVLCSSVGLVAVLMMVVKPLLHGEARPSNRTGAKAPIANSADVGGKGRDAQALLFEAVRNGPADLVGCLINEGAGVNAIGPRTGTPLHVAVENGRAEVAKLLIEKGARVNATERMVGQTPLHLAVRRADGKPLVELLLAAGADVNARDKLGKTPLDEAGTDDIKAVLRKHGGRPGKGAQTAHKDDRRPGEPKQDEAPRDSPTPDPRLIEAIKSGRSDLVKQILRNKTRTDGKVRTSFSAWHEAIRQGRTDIVELLIAEGVDVNIRERNGVSPLHVVVLVGYGDMVELLLKNGADVNAQDRYAWTPLDWKEREWEADNIKLYYHFTKTVQLTLGVREQKRPSRPIAELLREYGGRPGKELDQEAAE